MIKINTEYKPEMIEAIDDYLIRCSRRRDIEGNQNQKYQHLKVSVLFAYHDVSFKKWMAENEDLKIKLDFLIAIQVSLILDKGLTSNNYASKIAFKSTRIY